MYELESQLVLIWFKTTLFGRGQARQIPVTCWRMVPVLGLILRPSLRPKGLFYPSTNLFKPGVYSRRRDQTRLCSARPNDSLDVNSWASVVCTPATYPFSRQFSRGNWWSWAAEISHVSFGQLIVLPSNVCWLSQNCGLKSESNSSWAPITSDAFLSQLRMWLTGDSALRTDFVGGYSLILDQSSSHSQQCWIVGYCFNLNALCSELWRVRTSLPQV